MRFVFGTAVIIASLVAVAALGALGCAELPLSTPAGGAATLIPGTAFRADLDDDGTPETVLVETDSRRLIITDGSLVYRSREKWRVVQACLGDTDRNGLLEVVALLDAADGRHLGLLAFMSGGYRERLVTGVLTPRPFALQVVASQPRARTAPVSRSGDTVDAGAGDLLVLLEELPGGRIGYTHTTYRWNGFGFTALSGR